MTSETERLVETRKVFLEKMGVIFDAIKIADDFTNTVQSRNLSRNDIDEVAHNIHKILVEAKDSAYQLLRDYAA